MLALLATLAQSADPAAEVSSDTGIVAVVGFVIVGILAVIGARWHRRRNG